MPSYDASLAIGAPRESVWRALAAVVAWPKWLPTVSGVQALDGEPLQIGFRYTVRQPKLRPATWVVTELEPPRWFVWQARSPGLLMIASHTIEESSRGNCLVTLRFSFAGLLGMPIGLLFRSTTERYLAQELASLKSVAEGQQ
jgi:uncharacterized protein YndB with AHSA1/START domain